MSLALGPVAVGAAAGYGHDAGEQWFTNELRVSGDEAFLKGLAFKDIPGEWCGPIEFPADITSNEEAS